MGRVRGWTFDCVVGVGVTRPWPRSVEIRERIVWIGLGARRHPAPSLRGPVVTFDHFQKFDGKGMRLCELAPDLADRMLYEHNTRLTMSFSPEERIEIERILELAHDQPASHQSGLRMADACAAPRHAHPPGHPRPCGPGC
jgi:hypothetical protein